MQTRQVFENAVSSETGSFSLAALASTLMMGPVSALEAMEPNVSSLVASLTKSEARSLMQRLVRYSFFIQPVRLPAVNTTVYETRWGTELDDGDPRRQTFEGCVAVFRQAVALAKDAVSDPSGLSSLKGILASSLPPHEVPLDYSDRQARPIHTAENITWLPPTSLDPVLLQRIRLRQRTDDHLGFFRGTYSKVKVKTYLTDRVLTGEHKTNREIRWEVHPDSVHFALRRDCLQIENVLISAICAIADLPIDLVASLEHDKLREVKVVPTECPVTLEKIEYALLASELLNPVQGRSSYQVGHLNPLKAINNDPSFGHTAKNVGWISQDGNRIQGHLTLDETRAMLKRIASNYEAHALLLAREDQ